MHAPENVNGWSRVEDSSVALTYHKRVNQNKRLVAEAQDGRRGWFTWAWVEVRKTGGKWDMAPRTDVHVYPGDGHGTEPEARSALLEYLRRDRRTMEKSDGRTVDDFDFS